ncbi:translocation/assembly module TamB domain-containing protein, partial [Neisseria sp. P0009.S007]
VTLSSDTLKGTLIDGFEGDTWLIETEGADVKISSFRFDWKPSELTRPSLHITEVVAGDIAIVTKRTPPKEEEPSKGLPDSIDLPVTAYLDRLETGKISVGKRFDKQTVYLDHLHAAYHYDKKEHRLHIKTADTPWSSSTGAVVLGLNKPYVLNTAIYTKGQLEGETLHGTVRLWGSLQDVSTDLLLDSDNVHLSAKSTIHPFADSLNETVGEILIKGFNINPQAFLPSLPKARLNFDATTIPSFTNGVALEGSIDLENDQAGFADENHIPVKRILGEFIVDDKGTVMIEDIGVDLLKDGSIDVSGSIDTAQDQLKLALGINNTGADDFVRQNIAGRLNGSIDVKGETSSPVVNWNLDSGFARTDGMLFFQTDKQLGQRTLKLDKVRLVPQNGGELNAKGSLELFKDRKLQLDIVSKAFNPAR